MSMSAPSRTDGVEIRQATAYDMESFYQDGAAPCTVQAWVISHHGIPVVLAGVTLEETVRAAFMSIKPGAMDLVSKRAALELSREVFSKMVAATGACPLNAATDGKTPTADGYLRHLGFDYVNRYQGKELYRWKLHPSSSWPAAPLPQP